MSIDRNGKDFLYRLVDAASQAPVTAASVREANIREVLRLLRQYEPCSRADLVRSSGLTAPTVSSAVEALEQRGLIISLGTGSSNGGRPPGLLQFNARHAYVMGVDIGGSTVRVALTDLNGDVVGRWHSLLRTDRTPKAVVEVVAKGVEHLCAQHRVPLKRVLQIGAGAPGITDVISGRVVSAPNLSGWLDVPLRDLLEDRLQTPAVVDNDVNLGALGEGWKGAAKGVPNFLLLAIGTGVGSGLVMNGTLYHGANWSAGEVGYLLLPGFRPDPPSTSDPGALESVVGGHGVRKLWKQHPGVAASQQELEATQIFELAESGNLPAREILGATADHLAQAITNVSLILDLSLVVLSGGVGHSVPLLHAIARRMERNQFARPRLVLSALGADSQLHGAVWLALRAAETKFFRKKISDLQSVTG